LDPPLDRIRAHLALVANRDLYDPDHIDRVAALSVALGRRLGLTDVAKRHSRRGRAHSSISLTASRIRKS
jgi:hypothetical protein